MDRHVYMSRKQQAGRKANGQFSKNALNNMAEEIRERILGLKRMYYCSPQRYGYLLANAPRHAHAGGKRVIKVNNF